MGKGIELIEPLATDPTESTFGQQQALMGEAARYTRFHLNKKPAPIVSATNEEASVRATFETTEEAGSGDSV